MRSAPIGVAHTAKMATSRPEQEDGLTGESRLDVRIYEPGSMLLRQVQVIDQSLGLVDGHLGAFGRGVQ